MRINDNFRSDNSRFAFRISKCFLFCSLLLALCFSYGAVSWAQQTGKVSRIAILAYDQQRSNMESFFEELHRFGYLPDQNVTIELWNAAGRIDRLAQLADEVSRFKPDVVLASATPAAQAARKALPTTPVVFVLVADPVGAGLVSSLAHPAGNLTGLTNMNVELSGKRTELLLETFPVAMRIGVLTNPSDPISASQLEEIRRTVQAANRKLEVLSARESKDLQGLGANISKAGVQTMTVVSSQLFAGQRNQLLSAVGVARIPAIYWASAFVNAGGLMSYGVNVPELYRRAAVYVDRIIKGIKPSDLPVEQPKKFEFFVNLKTAKQIGLTIPPNVLVRADRVIK